MKDRKFWHKRYHDDALHGYIGLTLEERAVYTTCLDLIYSKGGRLPGGEQGERWIAGFAGCSPRKLRMVIAQLIERGKLTRHDDGTLSNDRADAELAEQRQRYEERAEAGRAGGLARGQNGGKVPEKSGENEGKTAGKVEKPAPAPRKINDLAEADLKQVRSQKVEAEEESVGGKGEAPLTNDRLQALLVAQLPEGCDWPLRNNLHLADVWECIREGADLERHVVAAVRFEAAQAWNAKPRRRIATWKAFKSAILGRMSRDARAADSAAASARSQPDEAGYRRWVEEWRRTGGHWPWIDFSEPPDSPHTKVPREILSEYGIGKGEAA